MQMPHEVMHAQAGLSVSVQRPFAVTAGKCAIGSAAGAAARFRSGLI